MPASDIAEERRQMAHVAFGRTASRRVLGTMNDFVWMARSMHAQGCAPETMESLMDFFARTPILPLEGASSVDMTRAAFRGH